MVNPVCIPLRLARLYLFISLPASISFNSPETKPPAQAHTSPRSGLDFTRIALAENLSSPTAELSASFRGAYGETLKPFHSFMVKPIFSAAMSACPYRKDFYIKLGEDEEKVQEELKVWLAALDKIIIIMKAFLDRKEAKL